MDELFERIANLEKEQKGLNDTLNNLNKEIETKKKNKVQGLWLSEEAKKKDKEEKEKNHKNLLSLYDKVSKHVENNYIKHTFSFTPLETSFDILFITGSFTNWAMVEIKKIENNTFTYTTYLKKGYEYVYYYSSGEDVLIDFNEKMMKTQYKKDAELNVLSLPKDDGTFIKTVDCDIKDVPGEANCELMEIVGDENEVMQNLFQMFKIMNERKILLAQQKQQETEKIMKTFNEKNTEFNEVYSQMVNLFNSSFKGRILFHDSAHYLIHEVNMKERIIRCLRLYDPNGIHSDLKHQTSTKRFSLIGIQTLFESSIILSKEESEIILKQFNDDNTHFIKILYQLQAIGDTNEKELLPYKVIPETVDINQYEFSISDNMIKEVKHKGSGCYVDFEPVLLGEVKGSTGLVASSSIKVYTTLYNKDILNILHIHINDTSQEITIDSEFLEKNEPILNHKVFPVDSIGQQLKYKLIFKDYKLVKIYYAMSADFIDEPPFEEVRFLPNGFVKITRGEYKNYYGRIRQFPLGMLARKDKYDTKLRKMNSFGIQKEGVCGDRHFAELPGFVVVDVIFEPGKDGKFVGKQTATNIPICHLIPLSPKENIEFEKRIITTARIKENENIKKIISVYETFKEFEKYITNPKELDAFEEIDKLKEILEKLEKNYNFAKVTEEDLNEKLNYITNIKQKLTPILYSKIRMLVLSGKK